MITFHHLIHLSRRHLGHNHTKTISDVITLEQEIYLNAVASGFGFGFNLGGGNIEWDIYCKLISNSSKYLTEVALRPKESDLMVAFRFYDKHDLQNFLSGLEYTRPIELIFYRTYQTYFKIEDEPTTCKTSVIVEIKLENNVSIKRLLYCFSKPINVYNYKIIP